MSEQVKAVYTPTVGKFIVEEKVFEQTFKDPTAGYWHSSAAYHDLNLAVEEADRIQESYPELRARVIERNETE